MKYDAFEKMTKIPFKVVDSQLVFLYDGKPLPELREGTIGDIIVSPSAIKDPARLQAITSEKVITFLPKDTRLLVQISLESVPTKLQPFLQDEPKSLIGGGKVEIFLQADLMLHLRSTKEAQLLDCPCHIPAIRTLDSKTEAKSLNHANTVVSTHFEPHRISHTGNVFNRIYYQDEKLKGWFPLRTLRDQMQADYEATFYTSENHSTAQPSNAD
jgi:hypothetical protein